MCGLVYNDTIFGEKNYSLPKTTNQFIELCSDMVSDGFTPFDLIGQPSGQSKLLKSRHNGDDNYKYSDNL